MAERSTQEIRECPAVSVDQGGPAGGEARLHLLGSEPAAPPLPADIPHDAFLVCHFPSFAFASLKLSWISFTLAGFFNIS